MPIRSIVLRWAGPSDATSGSSYKVERTVDYDTWTTVVDQVATAPYVSPISTLDADTAYGSTTIDLANAATFSNSGWLWLDDALVQWTGKTGNQLTGCTWHSGYGAYASGSTVYQAHESCSDVVDITNNAVVYRITHQDAQGRLSAPAHIWYYDPPVPEDRGNCVVIVNVGADLGVAQQAGVQVLAYLSTDDHFGIAAGQHLDSNAVAANSVTTNPLGLAFFHCWKNSARQGMEADQPYVFVLKPGSGALKVSASIIPDRDWVLLSQIVDAQVTG
jgi:hypothetical protein